jgi:hypothetical protein
MLRAERFKPLASFLHAFQQDLKLAHTLSNKLRELPSVLLILVG